MKTTITMTKQEYDELLLKFVDAWMEYQDKGYGCKLVSNETGKIITDKATIGGSILLPWNEVFPIRP